MRALKITISGSYRKAGNKIADFDGLTGIIPYCKEDVAMMHIRSRYATKWIAESEKYTDRLYSIREVFIDEIKKAEFEFSFLGKDIKEMSFGELQDLATYKDLRGIPLYKKSSLRESRDKACRAYLASLDKSDNKDLRGKPITKDTPYHLLPSLFIGATPDRIKSESAFDNEEEEEEESRDPESEEIFGDDEEEVNSVEAPRPSIEELKGIAVLRKISHSPNIGYEALYKKIYG